MKRREFVTRTVTAGAFAVGASASAATRPLVAGAKPFALNADNTFALNYAPHFGMFENHAGKDLLDQLKFMADAGFRALEDNRLMQRPTEMQEKIGNQLDKLGMKMGVFVVDKGGNAANSLAAGSAEFQDIFLNACKKAVEVSKRVNARWMTVVPGNFERKIPLGIQTANVIESLRRGAEILEPHGLVMVLEPLSDTPDLFLRHSDQTYLICKSVNSAACKLLYDIYHMQKNEGHIITNMDLTWDEIAYIQIGDNPGRKEPTTGEINYKNVFKHIYDKGYRGIMGMEHGNFSKGKEGEQAVIQAYRACDPV